MKKMSQKTKKLVSDLQELSTQDWSAFDAGLKRVAEHLDEKTFKSFCLSEKAYEEAFYSKPSNEGRYNRSEWVARRAVDTLIKLFPDIGDYINIVLTTFTDVYYEDNIYFIVDMDDSKAFYN